MRNLAQYPLEDKEILDWLDRQYEEARASLSIGGLECAIILELKKLVESKTTTTSTITARD